MSHMDETTHEVVRLKKQLAEMQGKDADLIYITSRQLGGSSAASLRVVPVASEQHDEDMLGEMRRTSRELGT